MNNFKFKYIVGDAQGFLKSRANDLIDLVSENNFDTLVFLDRSARPAAWIFEEFWSSKFPKKPIPPFVFICTGKKKNLVVNSSTLAQIEKEFKPQEKYLKDEKILIVDDIEKNGKQRKFVEKVIAELFEPKEIGFFEWNKLGGLRLPHGLSYEDYGNFKSKIDENKNEVVEQVKKEIKNLSTSY